jgi:hypothetical protein
MRSQRFLLRGLWLPPLRGLKRQPRNPLLKSWIHNKLTHSPNRWQARSPKMFYFVDLCQIILAFFSASCILFLKRQDSAPTSRETMRARKFFAFKFATDSPDFALAAFLAIFGWSKAATKLCSSLEVNRGIENF